MVRKAPVDLTGVSVFEKVGHLVPGSDDALIVVPLAGVAPVSFLLELLLSLIGLEKYLTFLASPRHVVGLEALLLSQLLNSLHFGRPTL